MDSCFQVYKMEFGRFRSRVGEVDADGKVYKMDRFGFRGSQVGEVDVDGGISKRNDFDIYLAGAAYILLLREELDSSTSSPFPIHGSRTGDICANCGRDFHRFSPNAADGKPKFWYECYYCRYYN